jgi:hypothetical protein
MCGCAFLSLTSSFESLVSKNSIKEKKNVGSHPIVKEGNQYRKKTEIGLFFSSKVLLF